MVLEVYAEDFLPYDKDGAAGPLPLYQHRSHPSLFSTDGGHTYYNLDEDLGIDGEAVIYSTH